MTDRTIVVGMDGGGTKTRAIVADGAGHVLASSVGGPSAITKDTADASADTIAALVSDVLAAAGVHETMPSVLCVGVAGAGRESARKALHRLLRAREIADDVIVTTDAQVALADAFGDGAGVLLIAGTGSVAYGRGPTGNEERCGGWGEKIGDEGSALWLARRALSAATAAADGREPQNALLGAILTATQCDEPGDLVDWSVDALPGDVAALAQVVIRAAENGDQRANTLAALAAEELVLHVRTLARQLFLDERAAVAVALTGGLLSRGSLIRKLVEHRLRSSVPGAVLHHDEVDPARGAVRLARKGVRPG
jgi:glucosamine kinase